MFAEDVARQPSQALQRRRRSPRRLSRCRLQEDQVLHERECRFGGAGPAGTADAHTGLLVDHPRRVALLPYGWDDRRDGVVGVAFALRQMAQLLLMCDRHDVGVSIGNGSALDDGQAPGGETAAVSAWAEAGRRARRPWISTNRASSSTTTTRAASASPSRCSRCARALLAKTRDLIATCPCASGCPSCVGPLGEVGPLAKTVALDILSAVS